MKPKTHILFLCTANIDRSPAAEELLNNSEYSKKYKAKSAGLHPLANIPVSKAAIEWADIIFVMDEAWESHKTILLKRFPEAKKKKIIIMGIPNIYARNDPELKKRLEQEFRKWF